MKEINFRILFIVAVCASFAACSKLNSSSAVGGFGFTKIYMPQSLNISGGLNANYPVPTGTDSSTFNYSLDTVNHKINVILGVAASGENEPAAYSVNVGTNSDTINQLIATGVLDTNTLLMPSSMYTLPSSVSVPSGTGAGTFNLSIDVPSLKASALVGKKLALAVSISNPTQYQIAAGQATTIVIVDVNALVIGPAVNVTASYLVNTGPFSAAGIDPNSGRFGTLTTWTANAAAKDHNGYGGFVTDNGGMLDMESGWGSAAMLNGKIYQTTSVPLPAGTYAFDCSSNVVWQGTLDPTYIVVSLSGGDLPDYGNVVGNPAVAYGLISAPVPKVSFQLNAPSVVTVGFVANYVQNDQGFILGSVSILNYPHHL